MSKVVPLLDPTGLSRVQAAIRDAGADGWLLYDFREQNPLAHSLLGLEKTTRRAFALLPAQGEPRLLRHAIEGSSWRAWPWDALTYAGHEELRDGLAALLEGVGSVAMEYSPGGEVPTVDRVPAGVVEMVRASGAKVVSSADLVSLFHSAWGDEGVASHVAAARIVRETALEAFARAAAAAGSPRSETEGALMDWICGRLRERGLAEQVGCAVAIGPTASDPHYHPAGAGQPVRADSLLLIDLWGAEPGGIPADQTWMAWIGDEPPARAVELWDAVCDARDAALALLRERAGNGKPIRGFEVDRAARDVLAARGLADRFVHRLGHSIDRELHGSGPNLDDLETRDDRLLLEGTGFSVEPGVYIAGEIGMRTEVNVVLEADGPRVTPDEIQTDLLVFPAS